MADKATGGRWSMDALLIEGFDLARYDAAYDGMFRFAVLTARAMGALTVRRLEQRNTRVTLPGTGETVGLASVVLEGYERGRIATLAMAGMDVAAGEGQPAQFSIAETKATKIDLGRTIAAMSSDKWFPGAPSGRIHVETAKRHGLRRRAVQALRHLAGRRQLPDDPGQGQGEPHAHAASRASCWRRRCAASKACRCAWPCSRWASRT